MTTISSISRVLLLVSWTAAGPGGCAPAADVRGPDIDDCPARSYRLDAIRIPLGGLDTVADSFDLDGDGVRDNWLGFASAVLHAWSPAFELAPVIDARLARELDWRLVVHQCEPGGAAAAALVPGAPASGDGTAPASAGAVETATGARAPGGTPLTGGTFAVPLGALSDALGDADERWVAAPLGQVRIDALDDRAARATVGLAVTATDVVAIVAPNLAAYFTARLAADDSEFAVAADADGDRIVTADELMASAAAQLLLAPDLADQPALAGDGVSLGFRIEATAVR